MWDFGILVNQVGEKKYSFFHFLISDLFEYSKLKSRYIHYIEVNQPTICNVLMYTQSCKAAAIGWAQQIPFKIAVQDSM